MEETKLEAKAIIGLNDVITVNGAQYEVIDIGEATGDGEPLEECSNSDDLHIAGFEFEQDEEETDGLDYGDLILHLRPVDLAKNYNITRKINLSGATKQQVADLINELVNSDSTIFVGE
jgi:hypothetical protein